MYVCMHVCMYVCLYVCMYVRTYDLREREHFCLISFEKCGEHGYVIRGEVQDEVVNVVFAPNFRRRQSTASAGSGRRCRLGLAASWLTVTVEVGRDMRVGST